MFNRGELPQRPQHYLQLLPRHAQLLAMVLRPRVWTMGFICVVLHWWWYMYRYTIPLYYVCYRRHVSHLTGVDHPTYYNITSSYTWDIVSCDPGYWNQELQPCTSSVIEWSKLGWIFYPTVLWVLYETWTTSDRGVSPHIPHHHLQLHPWHAHLLPLFLEPRAGKHIPHQWCSCPIIMTQILICYPTVLGVLYETWTMSDTGGSPHRPLYDLQPHLMHHHLLP